MMFSGKKALFDLKKFNPSKIRELAFDLPLNARGSSCF